VIWRCFGELPGRSIGPHAGRFDQKGSKLIFAGGIAPEFWSGRRESNPCMQLGKRKRAFEVAGPTFPLTNGPHAFKKTAKHRSSMFKELSQK
jgi:hypothetical protein